MPSSNPQRPPDAPSRDRHRILIVDDHPIYRAGLRDFISHQPDLSCCGEADSGSSALEAAAHLKPDLVIVDLRLRHEDGLDLVKQLQTAQPGLRILVLSQLDETVQAEPLLRAGALGYIMKEVAPEELLTAIHSVLQGEVYLSRRMSALILKKYFRGAANDPPSTRLSDRERQVFQLLGEGLGTREIATHLGVSVKTVDAHRENIKTKLNLTDADALVKAARKWLGE